MKIVPVASGKGGVGKSLLSVNLAIALAQSGKNVILVDLDLGGSNLHVLLGLRALPQGIGTFINDPSSSFESIIVDSGVKNLRFIPGDSEIPGMANIKPNQKRALIKRLGNLDCDFLIIDLGAGTTSNTIDFFLMSSRGIIITTPTLPATLNAYFFLKNAIFRILTTSYKKGSPGDNILKQVSRNPGALQKLYIPKLLEKLEVEDPAGTAKFKASVAHFQPRFVFNMIEDPQDVEKAERVRRSTREYLGIDLEHLGVIYRDETQDIAQSSRIPLILYKPQAVLSQAVYRVADKILQSEYEDEGPLDFQTLDESHQTAALEAEIDFDAKLQNLEELLHTGALTMGDLVETVKIQQMEINQLKKENLLLKSKIVKAMNAGFQL